MYTEEESKKLWCPHVRHEGEERGGSWNCNPDDANRPNAREENTGKYSCACIGSKCMMWRWDCEFNKKMDSKDSDCIGYCNLAGQPYHPVL